MKLNSLKKLSQRIEKVRGYLSLMVKTITSKERKENESRDKRKNGPMIREGRRASKGLKERMA